MPAPSPRPLDWLTVLDDVACHRVQHCTLCHGPLGLVDVYAWSNGVVVATVLLCQRCTDRRPAVTRMLERRYGGPGVAIAVA
jgi:hypothetical protein